MKKIWILFFIFYLPFSGYSRILKKPIPDKLVVLTFDDATASQYSFVAPLLKEYGFGATFFICEFPPNFKDTTKYMNWRQIRELDQMGFEIANHTRTHASASLMSENQFVDQLNAIENRCDSMGIAKPVSFAYPGYNLSPSVLAVLEGKGYQFARAGGVRPYDPITDHPLLLPSYAMTSKNKDQIMKALSEAYHGKIVILTIHGVPDMEHPWVTTSPEIFREYLQYLSENHYKVISIKDLCSYIHVKKAKKAITPDYTKKLKS